MTDAIAMGESPMSLLAKLRELEARSVALSEAAASLMPVPRLAPEVVENRLAEWRRLLRQSTTQGRAVLQRVLRGRLTFTPNGAGYDFSGPTRFEKLFSGIVSPRVPWIVPGDLRGTEHIGPEDTFDGDYGRLLDRAANGKGLASLTLPTWNQIAAWLSEAESLRAAGLAVVGNATQNGGNPLPIHSH